MTNLITGMMNQTAVYWAAPVAGGFGGYTFDDPVEISVRWEQKQELFIDAAGKEVRSNAVVYTVQDVDIGGYLLLGDLDDLDSTVIAPEDVTTGQAYEVRGFSKSPTIDGTRFVRKVWL